MKKKPSMASSSSKPFFAFLAISLLFLKPGRAVTCGPSNISVAQRLTGRMVEGDVEFEVTITNTCSCPQSNVIFSCSGFSTVETVDPNKFKKLNDQVSCLVNNGQAIQPSASVIFTYAWHTPFSLLPSSSNGSC